MMYTDNSGIELLGYAVSFIVLAVAVACAVILLFWACNRYLILPIHG